MIKEISQYIEDNTDFEIGVDLFAISAQAGIDGAQVILIPSGGVPNFYLPDASADALQVLTKSEDAQEALEYANEIFDLLHGKSGITLPEVIPGSVFFINTMEAVTKPQSLGQDEKGRYIFSTNYTLRISNAV